MHISNWYYRIRREKEIKKQLDLMKEHGKKLIICNPVYFGFPRMISLGNNIMIRENCRFYGQGGLSIGDGTIIAHDVQILTANHNYNSEDLEYLPFDDRFILKPVIIGKYVWIGARVTILPGVHIGDGAIIGAGSVVSTDIPDCAVACGNPAQVVKYRNKERYIQLLSHNKSFVKDRR